MIRKRVQIAKKKEYTNVMDADSERCYEDFEVIEDLSNYDLCI